jgi:hypothetical protein
MVDQQTFAALALSFQDTEELPHFEKLSYRWRNKIFATLDTKLNRGMVQLTLIDQDVFSAFQSGSIFYPVPGGWGKKGSTFVDLTNVDPAMLKDALTCAYDTLRSKHPTKK